MRKITFEYLGSIGWIVKSDVVVLFSDPRLGWKKDGTLIIGYHEYPEKVFDIDVLYKILNRLSKNETYRV